MWKCEYTTDFILKASYLVPERKVRLLVGWVESDLQCWVSYLNPTYDNQAFNTMEVQGAKPNNSIRGVFVQSLPKVFCPIKRCET
jgi:hypothetical protein